MVFAMETVKNPDCLAKKRCGDQINGRPLLRYSGLMPDCGRLVPGTGRGGAIALTGGEGVMVVTAEAGKGASAFQTERAGPDCVSRPI